MAPTSHKAVLLLLVLLCIANKTTASWWNGGSMRFTHWFSQSRHEFSGISTGVCNASLTAFETAYNTSSDIALINLGVQRQNPVLAACKTHASCILNNMSELQKASMATAGVVLGLMPTLLAVISPSLSELVLLSSQRPFLATILSVGAPGVLQRRIFEYEDPFELIEAPESLKVTTRSLMVLGPWKSWKSTTVGLLQWLLALACSVNTVALALQTGNNSILSWGCTRTWPLVLWVCVPTVIHWIGAVGYRITLDKTCAIRSSHHNAGHHQTSSLKGTDSGSEKTGKPRLLTHASSNCVPHDYGKAEPGRILFQQVTDWLTCESTSCASHSECLRLRHPQEHSTTKVTCGISLNCVASFLSFFHVLYGTVVFSALLFITNLDALGQVLTRAIASAIVCRFLVVIEMGGVRGAVLAANKQH